MSYYTLPSTIIGNAQYDTLTAAFMYYTVANTTPLLQLLNDALVLAHAKCAFSGRPGCLPVLRWPATPFISRQLPTVQASTATEQPHLLRCCAMGVQA